MSTLHPPVSRRTLSSEDGKTWLQSGPDCASDWPLVPDPSVARLVLGRLDQAGSVYDWGAILSVVEHPGLREHFPNLTHLHLWGLPLKQIGALPPALKELDVRNCPALEKIEDLPVENLEVLVLWQCRALASLAAVGALRELVELDLRDLPLVEEKWIHDAIRQCTAKLWKLDLSGCSKLASLPRLKVGLKDLRVNDCPKLTALPGNWPAGLRRLELANTPVTSEAIPAWVDSLDYVNLSGTAKMTRLPEGFSATRANFPRTLFLFGSGVRQPPAVLHGKEPAENVAKAVFRYFEQGREIGFGSIRRCKLLFLGNGQAGKTSLALALEGDAAPAETAKKEGSTHGIRLRSRTIVPPGTKNTDPVRLDHWDFGGQEIYHNAHCKFVQTGSLFLLVWYPEQDGKDEAVCPVTDYIDILHPLRYWLDLVASRTSGRGTVLIVASHCRKLSDELLKRCNRQRAGYVQQSVGVKAHDAATGEGQLLDISDWVDEHAGLLVEAEGEKVPAHWQIAEEMVNRWLSEATPERTRDLSFDQFRDDLSREVSARVAADEYGVFAKLAGALGKEDGFRIDDEITRQTLHVLTNLGALYWSEELFDRRVIVGQDWALRGIYAALDRTVTSTVFKKLMANQGRFTRSLLAGCVWNAQPDYESEGVQDLLISFMEDCQICFRLSGERWNGYGFSEPEYVSIKHLPTMDTLCAEGAFAVGRDLADLTLHVAPDLENRFMNISHWHAILADLGKAYGDRAQYALDGFYLPENDQGQSALIRVKIDSSLDGESQIFVETRGKGGAALKQEIVNTLVKRLPDQTDGKLHLTAPGALELAGPLHKQVTLFISYARMTDHTVTSDHYPYEDAIEAIEARLAGQFNIRILRDRNEIKDVSPAPGSTEASNVVRFMDEASKADFVLMVHSEKYWYSQYCMFEAWKSYAALVGRGVQPAAKFLLLDQGADAAKGGASRLDLDKVADYWSSFGKSGKLSAGLAGHGVQAKQLGSGAYNFLCNFYPELLPNNDQRKIWEPEKLDDIVEWIVRRCGFTVVKKDQ